MEFTSSFFVRSSHYIFYKITNARRKSWHLLLFFILLSIPNYALLSVAVDVDPKTKLHQTVSAGSSINSTIIIINPDPDEALISIYPVDTFVSSGSYIPGPRYNKENIFAQWIGKPTEIIIAPRTEYRHTFNISIPKDTPNGIYHGAIVTNQSDSKSSKNSSSISISTEVAMGIVIDVKDGTSKLTSQKPIEIVNEPIKILPAASNIQQKNILPQVSLESKHDSEILTNEPIISLNRSDGAPDQSKNNKLMILIIFILFFLIGGIILLYFFKKK